MLISTTFISLRNVSARNAKETSSGIIKIK